ncbi:MAG: hypothetical protein V7K27_19995 [Nostoc sp.]|uniref:hypothetical protein n=1 Tax=Nostoc sp. TaxID=1180 RepID=UPI002FF65A50
MFAQPQKSLIPVGGNFYATPDTPADPRDCDRYPNSPYCNGGWLDITPIRVTPQIVFDECNLGVAIQGTLGFIRLPVLQIVHRNTTANCQLPPPPLPPSPEDLPEGKNEIAYCANGDSMYAVIASSLYVYIYDQFGETENIPMFLDGGTSVKIWSDIERKNAKNRLEHVRQGLLENNAIPNANRYRNIKYIQTKSEWSYRNLLGIELSIATKSLSGDISYQNNGYGITLLQQSNGLVLSAEWSTPDNPENWILGTEGYSWLSTKFESPPCPPPSRKPPPPPPPPKMECCPGQSDNDQLLKLILKRIGTLPTTVLTSHLTKTGVQPAQTQSIESLTDFISWFAERFDETLGEFEITVQVNNPDDSGKSQTIHLPNLAEAMAEMFTMMIHTNINNELLLNVTNRTLAECGQIKQSDFKIFNIVNAIVDYLGFHTKIDNEQMPLTFTPGKTSFSSVLVDSTQDVAVIKYKEKETIAAAIHSLLQAAAIIRGVHYAKTPGDNAAIVNKLKESLATLSGESGNLSDQVASFVGNVEKVYDGINKPS